MARKNNDEIGFRKLNMVGNKSYAVSLPVELIRQLKWHKGDTLIARRQASTIIIEKQEES